MKQLRGHLEGSPFQDWLQLHGRDWIEQQSADNQRAIFGGYEKTAEFLADVGRLHSSKKGLPCPSAAANDIVSAECHTDTWVTQILSHCRATGTPCPVRLASNRQDVASSLHAASKYDHAMLCAPRLVLDCGVVSGSPAQLEVTPPVLLSRASADALFGTEMRKVVGQEATFAEWVAVEWSPSAAVPGVRSRRISASNRTTRYMAARLQAAHEVVKSCCGESTCNTANLPRPAPRAAPVCGVVAHPTNPTQTAKFYVSEAPTWTLDLRPSGDGGPSQDHSSVGKRYIWTDALSWYVQLKRDGHLWDPVADRDRLEMCPPVSDRATGPRAIQLLLSWLRRERADMCMLYRLSASHREKAWKKGARTYHDVWRMQKVLKPLLKLPEATWASLWANAEDNPERSVVTPRRLATPGYRTFLQSVTGTEKYFAVDFETIRSDWIFMVAVACVDPAKGTCEVFVEQMNRLTDTEQAHMLKRWIERMHRFAPLVPTTSLQVPRPDASHPTTSWKAPPLLHWSSAEPVFLSTLFRKKPQLLDMLGQISPLAKKVLQSPPRPSGLDEAGRNTARNTAVKRRRKDVSVVGDSGLCWADLCTVFLHEPIAIPGCFDFQLKHVVRALVQTGTLPDTHVWAQDGVQDGLAAMRHAEEVYAVGAVHSGLECIRKYNEADVLVLVDMINHVLRRML